MTLIIHRRRKRHRREAFSHPSKNPTTTACCTTRRVETTFQKLISLLLIRRSRATPKKVWYKLFTCSHVVSSIIDDTGWAHTSPGGMLLPGRGSEYKHPLIPSRSLRTYEFHFMSGAAHRLFICFFFGCRRKQYIANLKSSTCWCRRGSGRLLLMRFLLRLLVRWWIVSWI